MNRRRRRSVLSAFKFYLKTFIFRVTMNKRRDLSVEEKLDVMHVIKGLYALLKHIIEQA